MTNREFLKETFKAFIKEINCNSGVHPPIRIEDVDYITVHFKEGTPTNPEKHAETFYNHNRPFQIYDVLHYTEKIVMTEKWLDKEHKEDKNE